MELDRIASALRNRSLALRGAFHPMAEDAVPSLRDGRPAETVVLAGNVGAHMWRAFSASQRRGAHPLDAWSKELLTTLAADLAADALFPGDGPPYLPFQRWAMRAEPVHQSPLGILIHPDYGLWHGYRGALVLAERIALPPRDGRPSPCQRCVDKPCLSSCPVDAFQERHYEVATCLRHLEDVRGEDCRALGCRARRACPVGRAHTYGPDQARFHMSAFVRARSSDRG